jgi:hypothetical protein
VASRLSQDNDNSRLGMKTPHHISSKMLQDPASHNFLAIQKQKDLVHSTKKESVQENQEVAKNFIHNF